MRSDDGAVPVYRAGLSCRRVVPENELASGARLVIGTEKKPGQWIRVNVAFEPHRGAVLDVQDDAITIIGGRRHAFRARSSGQLNEVASVKTV